MIPLILVDHMIIYDVIIHRAIVDAINMAALNCNQCLVPLNKGDNLRTKALTREVDQIDQVRWQYLETCSVKQYTFEMAPLKGLGLMPVPFILFIVEILTVKY